MKLGRRLHRAQYVIGPRRVSFGKEWIDQELKRGLVLSYDGALPVQRGSDRRGRHWWLLGRAIEGDPLRPSPMEAVAAYSGDDPMALTHSWAGRWLLSDGSWVFPDASSLLPCYVLATSEGTWTTSSPALALQLAGFPVGAKRPRLVSGRMNWFPPPRSRSGPARRLLPSQMLRLSDGVTRTLKLNVGTFKTYPEILKSLETNLVSSVKRACDGVLQIHLPLSAGYDSRLLLAVCKAAGLEPRCFTFRKRNSRGKGRNGKPSTGPTLRADMILPPELATLVGAVHRWISIDAFSAKALDQFDRHCAAECIENDRFYVSHGQWDWASEDAVILRGGVFEVGRCFYWQKLPAHPSSDSISMITSLLKTFGIPEDCDHADSLRMWCSWAASHPEGIPVTDWRDRFYIEQRVAGWLASLEQALDLVPGIRFYPANSRKIFEWFAAVPPIKRRAKLHHTDLIERLAPSLLELPFNPPDPLWYDLVRKTKGKSAQLARMSPREAVRELIRLGRKYTDSIISSTR